MIERFQNREISVEEFGITGGIGKQLDNYDTDSAQVRGTKYANAMLKTNFTRGSKPKRLYLDRMHPDFFERIESEIDDTDRQIYTECSVDWEKMLDKTLKEPIERVLKAIGIS